MSRIILVKGRSSSFLRLEWLASLGLLLLLGLLAYAPWMARLGFYRDDWYVLWAGAVRGPQAIVTMFSIDRPVVGVLFARTYAWFGDNALAWQTYSFGLRWLTAVLTLVLLRGLWPSRKIATTAAAALVLLYPGFLQQPNAMTFSNQLTTYAAALLSITLTMFAVRSRRPRVALLLTAAALLTALFYQLLYEYMIGLEVGRVLVLWLLTPVEENAGGKVRWVVRRWLPYALVALGQIFWRSAVFHSARGATDLGGISQAYFDQPLRLLAQQGAELVKDLADVLVAGWAVPYYDLSSTAQLRPTIIGFLLAGAGVLATSVYAWWLHRYASAEPAAETRSHESDGRQMAVAGGVLLVLGHVPLIFAFRDVRWGNGYDRYTLQATLAASLVTVGSLWAFTRPAFRRWALMGLLALAIVTQYLNGLHWAGFWEAQQQLWWQLAWRAPQIEPGTVLLAELPVDGYYEDYEVWGPANLIYYPTSSGVQIASEVFTEATAEKVRLGVHDERGVREIAGFSRDYNRVLVASRPTVASCVHFLDGRRPEFPLEADGLVRSLAPYSNTSLIDLRQAPILELPGLFGPEPGHGWCTFYQQASQARQRGDWAEVLRLAVVVEDGDHRPLDRSEWLPFLEAYVAAGRTDQAAEIASRIGYDEEIRHSLCDAIANVPPPGFSPENQADLMRVLCE